MAKVEREFRVRRNPGQKRKPALGSRRRPGRARPLAPRPASFVETFRAPIVSRLLAPFARASLPRARTWLDENSLIWRRNLALKKRLQFAASIGALAIAAPALGQAPAASVATAATT